MKSPPLPWFVLPILALCLGACEKAPPPAPLAPAGPKPDEKLLFQTLQDNADATNKKDVDGIMATVHPDAPDYATVREQISQVFAQVTLKVSLSNLKVIESSPDEAKVQLTLKTEYLDGQRAGSGSHVDEIDVLRPDKGKWKIYGVRTVGDPVIEGSPLSHPPLNPPGNSATPPSEPAPKPETPGAPATPEPKATPSADKPPQ